MVEPKQEGEGVSPVALLILIAVLLLPLWLPGLLAVLVSLLMSDRLAVRWRYWMTHRTQAIVAALGAAIVLALTAWEVVALLELARELAGRTDWLEAGWAAVWPWLIVNFAAGIFLVPAGLLLARRAIASRVRKRRSPDVVRQEEIERARRVAADVAAAKKIGVQVDVSRGRITGLGVAPTFGPHLTKGAQAFGVIHKPTIRNIAERFKDRRSVPDWTSRDGRMTVLPASTSAVRALLVAESGTGKTVLLNDWILGALQSGWRVFFVDAKGMQEDARDLAGLARELGHTATHDTKWRFWSGTSTQITNKLMRLMPEPDGANQYYLNEIRGVLQMIQASGPLTSLDDLRARTARPAKYIDSQADAESIMRETSKSSGESVGDRVYTALSLAMHPLGAHLSDAGWNFVEPTADLTIVPLMPVDDAQAKIGDLIMLDLRNYIEHRSRTEDSAPVLVVIDEFPQLVSDGVDAGDTAARLYETCRSVGIGLVLAAQSTAGLSTNDGIKRRALASGAALILGRSKDPEDAVSLAGTDVRMEAGGSALGDRLGSARAQNTFLISPQSVREALPGAFWIIQGGGVASFRALPAGVDSPAPASAPTATVLSETTPEQIEETTP